MTLNVHPKKGRKGQLYDFQVLVRPAEAKSSKESRAIPGQLEYHSSRRALGILVLLGCIAVTFGAGWAVGTVFHNMVGSDALAFAGAVVTWLVGLVLSIRFSRKVWTG